MFFSPQWFKVHYYIINTLRRLVPSSYYQAKRKQLLTNHLFDEQELQQRVDYYIKITQPITTGKDQQQSIRLKKNMPTAYFFDFTRYFKYFPDRYRAVIKPGDVRETEKQPTLVKSRPISDDNHNNILLKLNQVRHFYFVDDPLSYQEKKDIAVWRGAVYQANREHIIQNFYQHPRCDFGQTKPINGDPWEKPFLSIKEQLQYKFIVSLEGNDVATNLKWIMSSNSICIMPKPTRETWFMEGKLQAGIHYIEVKPDFSDLEEQLDYYLNHPEKAEAIIENAHKWVAQFLNKDKEQLLNLMVLERYFKLNGFD